MIPGDFTHDSFIRETSVHDPSTRELFALRVLQIGAVGVILAASQHKLFELDRYFVPKDLVLHATAFLALVAVLRSFRDLSLKRIDVILLLYIALGTVSAVFAANHWVAFRSLALSASGIGVFLAARAVRAAGLSKRLLGILAFAVVAGALTALLQTYGVRTDFFSINRAPGGTLGNRNFVAHLAAFGLPLVLLAALRARNMMGYLLRAIAVTVVLATLVITRSRAAWLAFAAVIVVFVICMLLSRALRGSSRTWGRLVGVAVLAGMGIGIAVFAPNSLRWNSANPYLDSVKGVANYQEGSGHGRLIQYRQSLKMAVAHPLFGVGPGNWAVLYPKHAARRDPSLDYSEPGTTSNPWPSSDWVAFTSERGFAAVILLALALLVITFQTVRRIVSADVDDALESATLLATLAAVAIAGAFDAVLLLALPTLLVWATIGALWAPDTSQATSIPPGRRNMMLAALALLCLGGAIRSASQLAGMTLYSPRRSASTLWAARVDPGNYRAQLMLGRGGAGLKRAARCRHANAAHSLYPSAGAARDAASGCTKR